MKKKNQKISAPNSLSRDEDATRDSVIAATPNSLSRDAPNNDLLMISAPWLYHHICQSSKLGIKNYFDYKFSWNSDWAFLKLCSSELPSTMSPLPKNNRSKEALLVCCRRLRVDILHLGCGEPFWHLYPYSGLLLVDFLLMLSD